METPAGREPAVYGGDVTPRLFQRARELVREAQNAISTSRTWRFETMLGHGSYGVTILLSERNPVHRYSRKVVLKLPLVPGAQNPDFAREAQILEVLRGHAHIVQIINYAQDISEFRPRGGRIRRALRRLENVFRNPPENLFSYLGRLSRSDCPAILLEYLENGNLYKIMDNLYSRRYQLPNRILWGWYHCLVSACVAMTYERQEPGPRTMELEVPQRNLRHLRIVHDDIAARNVMIGERDPFDRDHRSIPKLTMIDFGAAHELPPNRQRNAEDANLEGINIVMLQLINPPLGRRNHVYGPYAWNGITTMAAGIFDRRRTSLLDPELQTLIAQSFRVGDRMEPLGRPSLAETFERTKRGMLKPVESYPARLRETDDYIRARLQRIIYDADRGW
ncbi:hypothetical protein F5Y03DRAFT_209186 [Xylaria venustula]|nr:hypothetical protein F5Y03DRAFT_209186 [Xylaria venustula]